jgi:hypothetical protein
MANKYLLILQYLQQFEGDGQYHEIDHLLEGMNLDQKKNIINDLVKEELIDKQHRSGFWTSQPRGFWFIGDGYKERVGGPSPDWKSTWIPYMAKITFKGKNHLKNEIEPGQNQANMNNISNSTIIVGSSNVNVTISHQQTELVSLIQKIVEQLESGRVESDAQNQQILELYQTLLAQAQSGKIEKETALKALTIGDSVSSIGSFVLSLGQLLLPLIMR